MRILLTLLIVVAFVTGSAQTPEPFSDVLCTVSLVMHDCEVEATLTGELLLNDSAFLGFYSGCIGYTGLPVQIAPGEFEVSLVYDCWQSPLWLTPDLWENYGNPTGYPCHEELGISLCPDSTNWWTIDQQSEELWHGLIAESYVPFQQSFNLDGSSGLHQPMNVVPGNSSLCGEGTIWDGNLEQCVAIDQAPDTIFVEPNACVPSCGEGTVWNPVLHECVVAIPADVDLSGCITAGDLLALLPAFGSCPPAPDFPDTPEDALWTCGDLVEYWGYAYETVAIGTQCWFAENLKSSKFRDGEELILAQSDSSWEANAWTYAYCTVEGTSNNLEFLYKGGVVENPIEICPSGWHIPFDQDWMDLEADLGMPDTALTLLGTRGSNELVGGRMKSNSAYWDIPNVLAPNPSGFNAEPCGYRNHLGYMYDQNATTHFWNADPQGGNDSHARVLFHDLGGVYRYGWNGIGGTLGQRFGRSIRCIKD